MCTLTAKELLIYYGEETERIKPRAGECRFVDKNLQSGGSGACAGRKERVVAFLEVRH